MGVGKTWKTWCAMGVLAGLAACSVTIAREGQVQVRGGKIYAGEIAETPETVRVSAGGVETTLDRTNIVSVAYAAGLDEQYEQQLEKLNARDISGRLELSRWAFDHHRYDLAEDAIDLALAIDPEDRESLQFQHLIRTQKRMEASKEKTVAARPRAASSTTPVASQPSGGEGGTVAVARTHKPVVPGSFLSGEEINRIRQTELKDTDRGVKLRFDNDVIRRYAIVANIPLIRFTAYDRIDQAIKIINDPDPAFREDVRVLSDPPSLTEFRMRVLPTVINGCASSGCHGSAGAGDFFLYNRVTSEAVAYTDFYLLQTYVKTIDAGGGVVFGGPIQRKMIDRNRPNMSLLLQYALPPDLADIDHPNVHGWKPLLKSQEDLRYRDLLSWIRVGLTPVEPDYGIKYEVPVASLNAPDRTSAPRKGAAARAPVEAPAESSDEDHARYTPAERFKPEMIVAPPGAPAPADKPGDWGLTLLNEAARLQQEQKQREQEKAAPAGGEAR